MYVIPVNIFLNFWHCNKFRSHTLLKVNTGSVPISLTGTLLLLFCCFHRARNSESPGSTVQSRNFWVAQRTIHESLGCPCYFRAVRIWCDQKLEWNNYIVICNLLSTSNKKVWDWYFRFSNCLEIWQETWQQCCQAMPVIFQSACLEYFKTQPHSFESSRDMRDLKIRRLSYNLVNRGPVSMSHVKQHQRKIFWKFISRETDYPTCNCGLPVMFMGHIWRPSSGSIDAFLIFCVILLLFLLTFFWLVCYCSMCVCFSQGTTVVK